MKHEKKVNRIIVDVFEYVGNEKTEMQIIKTKNEVKNMEKKTIAKSIRMKPSIYEFINSHSGDGFNEKFETVVRRYSLDSKKLVEENRCLILENAKLNEMIYEKRNLLDRLCNLENDLRTVFFQIKKLNENKVEGF